MTITIPQDFFKAIGEKPPIYRILWIKWFAEYAEEIGTDELLDKFYKSHSDKNLNLEQVKDAYDFGLQFFRDGLILKKGKRSSKTFPDDFQLIIQKTIEYLNHVTGSSFTANKANSECIAARIKEGYTLDELKIVIDNKASDWMGTEQQVYLRPITLFQAKKFENYLNQPKLKINGNKQSTIQKLSSAADIAKTLLG
jgi:uncharacterized phage protein (TIGR02220 family)